MCSSGVMTLHIIFTVFVVRVPRLMPCVSCIDVSCAWFSAGVLNDLAAMLGLL